MNYADNIPRVRTVSMFRMRNFLERNKPSRVAATKPLILKRMYQKLTIQ